MRWRRRRGRSLTCSASRSAIVVALACALGGCGNDAPVTTDAGTDASGETSISWTGNDNGVSVIDANGNAFRFTDGCMYSLQNGVGPEHFCLTPTASNPSGYASSGATNCSSPSSNGDCNAASFGVVLTTDPGNSAGCIAVLTDASATSLSGEPLSVTQMTMGGTVNVGGGGSTSTVTGYATTFDIQTDPTPTAYRVYWNGVVPICGDDGPYAGAYVGSITNAAGTETFPVSLTVDSGDLINDDATRTTGSLTATGGGSFSGTYACSAGCGAAVTFDVTVTGASPNAAGKEVLSGTASVATSSVSWTFSATQQ